MRFLVVVAHLFPSISFNNLLGTSLFHSNGHLLPFVLCLDICYIFLLINNLSQSLTCPHFSLFVHTTSWQEALPHGSVDSVSIAIFKFMLSSPHWHNVVIFSSIWWALLSSHNESLNADHKAYGIWSFLTFQVTHNFVLMNAGSNLCLRSSQA